MATSSVDSALVRGVRTVIHGALGVLVTFLVGLAMAVWNVPGVPDAVLSYVGANLLSVMGNVGLSAGTVAFIWNVFRKDVPNF